MKMIPISVFPCLLTASRILWTRTWSLYQSFASWSKFRWVLYRFTWESRWTWSEKSRGHRKRPNAEVVEAEAEEPAAQPPAKRVVSRTTTRSPSLSSPMDSPIVKKYHWLFGFNQEILSAVISCPFQQGFPQNLYFVSEPIANLVNGGNEKLRVINTELNVLNVMIARIKDLSVRTVKLRMLLLRCFH